jgi:hypothetical protein
MDSGEAPPDWESGDVIDMRAEALDVVSDALEWRLAEARWEAVEQVLVVMDAALEAGDPDALAAATADLELAGPLRITRIGATPVVPPAPPIRDRLDRLVHSLGGGPAAQHQEDEDSGAGNDGASGS